MNINLAEAVALLIATFVSAQSFVSATKETVIPVNDAGEGSQCDQDQKVANTCLACSAMDLNIPLVECCSDETYLAFCSACIDDNDSCRKFIEEVSELEDSVEDDSLEYDSGSAVSKRFGRLFMKSPRKYWGRRTKRYGTLFMKSPNRYRRWFGKRDGGESVDEMDKRYGRLYLGRGGYFGKFGKRDGGDDSFSDEYLDTPDKRYGRLYIGNGGYFGKFGKRDELEGDSTDQDEYSDTPDKRYGRLFIGNNGGFYGKRDVVDYGPNEDKRYGRLFMGSGNYFGKRAPENVEDYFDGRDKRYGKLFVGYGGGYFGKRGSEDEIITDNDMISNYVDSGTEGDNYFPDSDLSADKRYGRLFMGGKFGRLIKGYGK